MHQKPRLLRALQIAAPPIRSYRRPVHLPQVDKSRSELRAGLGGIPKGEGPGHPLAIRLLHDRVQVGPPDAQSAPAVRDVVYLRTLGDTHSDNLSGSPKRRIRAG